MLVDDNQVNLNIGKNMLKDLYEVYALPSAERLFAFLDSVTPDLILLDVAMPNMSGFDIIKVLKADTRYADIPVIFVTAKIDYMNEYEGLSLGAVDYVAKPFSATLLRKRIENHLLLRGQQVEMKKFNDNLIKMVKDKTTQVFDLQNLIISTISDIVEFRDSFTGEHINRTQQYVRLLVDYMIEHGIYADETYTWEDMEYILPSIQLHDLGKIFISDAILNKPEKLTPEEFEIMKGHVVKGVEVIKNMSKKGKEQTFLKYAEIVAATHHEKWDGSGYPYGLKGQNIPLLGRLMAIADVYDALTSTRPYKKPFTVERSAQIIIESSGTHFDPTLVDIFKQVEPEFISVASSNCVASDAVCVN